MNAQYQPVRMNESSAFHLAFYVLSRFLQPARRHAYAQGSDNVFTPVERELIFDIVSCLILQFKTA